MAGALWGGIAEPNQLRVIYDASTNPLPGTIVPCLLCAKPYLMRAYSGRVDQVCPECYSTFQECALLTCLQCKCVIARVVPKLLDSGYYIRPQSVLRTSECSICNPGLEVSTIVEIDEWMRRNGSTRLISIPTRTQVERINMEQRLANGQAPGI